LALFIIILPDSGEIDALFRLKATSDHHTHKLLRGGFLSPVIISFYLLDFLAVCGAGTAIK
jgi:hypothetical protein